MSGCWMCDYSGEECYQCHDRRMAKIARGEPVPESTEQKIVRLTAEVKEVVEAGLALVTWYDRDGSVGGLCDPIEDMRAILAKHEG